MLGVSRYEYSMTPPSIFHGTSSIFNDTSISIRSIRFCDTPPTPFPFPFSALSRSRDVLPL